MALQKIKITPRVALEVTHHEAIIRRAYKDSKKVWTWGPGITSSSGHNVERYIDNPQPMTKVLEVFVWLLDRYANDVLKAFEGYALKEHEFAAALSFHWNTGAIERASWVREVKRGNLKVAREYFMLWRNPPEIISRRERERDLFFDGKWSGDGTTTEFTRLNKSYSPIWSSGHKVNIRADLEQLLGSQVATPQPPVVIVKPEDPAYNAPSFWERVKAFFAGLLKEK